MARLQGMLVKRDEKPENDDSGDFAVTGIDVTDAAKSFLSATAGCGTDERILRVPRRILVDAKAYIPTEAESLAVR